MDDCGLRLHGDKSVRLWDISALDVGPKAEYNPEELLIRVPDTIILGPLRTQLRTLPLCHVAARRRAPRRPAAWLAAPAAAGWPLPLALAHDLGLLLTQPADRLTIAKPSHLPFDEDTAAYLAFLQRVAAHPLVRQLPSWRPPLSDAVTGVILARLIEGVALPDAVSRASGAGRSPAAASIDRAPQWRPRRHDLSRSASIHRR